MAEFTQLTKQLEDEANRIEKAEREKEKIKAQEEDAYDGFSDTKLKLIPTPNFTDCASVGTMLPINLASETVTNISKYASEFDLVEFVREKLGYASRLKVCQSFSSEQIDALVLGIKSFEKNNGFILGDMAGIGKGRICAGVMRYAYQQNLIPIFITHKPYLFTDIVRDLTDIDGFGSTKSGKMVIPNPFILNGNDPEESSIKNIRGEKVVVPLKPRQIMNICQSGKLPKEFNSIFLTYSQLSQTRKDTKQNFLLNIAQKSLLIFDESHNAASANENSRIMKRAVPLIEACKGVLFSSATYAKTPDVFGLYVLKTSLRTAVPSLKSITDALKVGGENVSEYISSGLVSEGQMIRRERSFGDCKKVTEYVGDIRIEDVAGQSSYIDDPNDNQRQFYDEAIGYFKELRDFAKSQLATQGIQNAVIRRCNEIGKNVVTKEQLDRVNASDQRAKNDFIQQNIDGWVLSYTPDSISRYKATFRENLFLAVKSKFAADKVLECLDTEKTYKNVNGSEHYAPLKPMMAIRNTGEAIFNELGLKEGDELNNDFSEYLRAVYRKIFSGTFKLRKIDNNIFKSIAECIEDGSYDLESGRVTEDYIIEEEYDVVLSDFADNGLKITEIQEKLQNYRTSLPLSAIDYMREMIVGRERPDFYYTNSDRITPRFGLASSQNYNFSEATGRKSRLIKRGDKYVYTRVQKEGITKIFRGFNNGSIDVMLLNVTASTGGSAQSSPKEGIDTRPRNMFIIQFELDINIEVQKRGRVNRTGQLNSPTYTYIITKIPVELRTYLMFRKKLRKLDANTSANQVASSETADISDDKGNVIEDIFNAYGFNVFKKDFIDEPENLEYKAVYDGMSNWTQEVNIEEGTAEADERNIESFNAFVRELELYPATFQEVFFNRMNEKYIQEIEKLKALNEYQLELEAKNYKASLKQRVVIQLNSGSTIFSMPLFLSDYYTLEDNRAWSKEKVFEKNSELTTIYYNDRDEFSYQNKGDIFPIKRNLSNQDFHIFLIRDYRSEFAKYTNILVSEFNTLFEPKREDYADGETYQLDLEVFQRKRFALTWNQDTQRAKMLDLLSYYYPMREVSFEGVLGYFVGYKILDKGTKFKYSEGSIEFIFCFLNRYPILRLKASSDSLRLSAIKTETNFLFGSTLSIGDEARTKIRNWRPNYNQRTVRRFLAGNILGGIIEANKKKAKDEIRDWSLVRFTNIDGSLTTAIELKTNLNLTERTQIIESDTELAVSSDNQNFLNYINDVPSVVGNDIPEKDRVVWNVTSDKVIERSICIFNRYLPYQSKDLITIQFVQQYKEVKEEQMVNGKKQEVVIGIEDLPEKSTRYSKIFYDKFFDNKYKNNIIEKKVQKKIKYGQITNVTFERGVRSVTTKYNDMKVFVKTFTFESMEGLLNEFLVDLYLKYQVSFNFRAEGKDYFNVSTQEDIFDPTIKSQEKKRAFDVGEYKYRFTQTTPENIISNIPNLIERTPDGVYGGVVVGYPITPDNLPSYNMIPYRFDNQVMINLTFSVLSEQEKTNFARELENSTNLDDVDFGIMVEEFLKGKTVGIKYFVGNLRTPEYGKIFKEFALNNDVASIVIEEKAQEEEVLQVPRNSQITYQGAENFLIELYKTTI